MSRARRTAVLLVDDDPDWRDILADHLDGAGFSVAVAADGYVAWQSFLESEPLVVVTDVQMPFMDGRELLANVRARNFRVPVIVVTASEELSRTTDLGAAYIVITKPADPDRVIAAINAAIYHRTTHTPLAKLWTVAASAPPLVHSKRAVVARWWLSARRGPVGAICLIFAALIVVVAQTTRSRPRGRR